MIACVLVAAEMVLFGLEPGEQFYTQIWMCDSLVVKFTLTNFCMDRSVVRTVNGSI